MGRNRQAKFRQDEILRTIQGMLPAAGGDGIYDLGEEEEDVRDDIVDYLIDTREASLLDEHAQVGHRMISINPAQLQHIAQFVFQNQEDFQNQLRARPGTVSFDNLIEGVERKRNLVADLSQEGADIISYVDSTSKTASLKDSVKKTNVLENFAKDINRTSDNLFSDQAAMNKLIVGLLQKNVSYNEIEKFFNEAYPNTSVIDHLLKFPAANVGEVEQGRYLDLLLNASRDSSVPGNLGSYLSEGNFSPLLQVFVNLRSETHIEQLLDYKQNPILKSFLQHNPAMAELIIDSLEDNKEQLHKRCPNIDAIVKKFIKEIDNDEITKDFARGFLGAKSKGESTARSSSAGSSSLLDEIAEEKAEIEAEKARREAERQKRNAEEKDSGKEDTSSKAVKSEKPEPKQLAGSSVTAAKVGASLAAGVIAVFIAISMSAIAPVVALACAVTALVTYVGASGAQKLYNDSQITAAENGREASAYTEKSTSQHTVRGNHAASIEEERNSPSQGNGRY